MIEVYNIKIIQSGKHFEVYRYKDKKILRGYKREKHSEELPDSIEPIDWAGLVEEWGDKEEKEKLHTQQTQKTKFSISRTRTSIRRLTNSNPNLNQFLTLTFAQSTPDLEKANNLFHSFIKRIMRAHPYFQYISVNEFQKDMDYHGRKKENGGSVHYHLLCNLGPKDRRKEQVFAWERKFALKYWKNGFVKIKNVQQVTNMGAYFCKYLSKDMFDKRMFRKKKFFCSQTLQKPVELLGKKAMIFFDKYAKDLKPIFEKTFKSEWSGEIDYKSYAMRNNPLDINE
jgi:hypothetical protein